MSEEQSGQRIPIERMSASFRDPAGVLVDFEGRLLRIVRRGFAPDLKEFLASATAERLLEAGSLVGTEVVDAFPASSGGRPAQPAASLIDDCLVLEHERVPFPSYPYEWPPEMLHAAGVLTLDLARQLLPDGYGLKDGTPYNILFRGPAPVFVDVLSFERRIPGDPTWRPYAQFVRTFLLPLLLNRQCGLRLDQILTSSREGPEPEAAYRLLGPLRRMLPPALSLVTLPHRLGRFVSRDNSRIYETRKVRNPEMAQFVLDSLFRRLQRALRKLEPKAGSRSAWSDYMDSGCSYSAADFEAKSKFLADVLRNRRPRKVLDVGCNTGHFSALAAGAGASVVAIDQDPAVVGEVWRMARAKRLNILPLVVDLARPSPPTGWLNKECPSFLDRARGSFDAVLMLALLHHLLVTERVPLDRVLSLAADLTTDLLVIEYVGPEDPMFRRLLRGRGELHRDLTTAAFEEACRERFEIAGRFAPEGATRAIYCLRKKQPA